MLTPPAAGHPNRDDDRGGPDRADEQGRNRTLADDLGSAVLGDRGGFGGPVLDVGDGLGGSVLCVRDRLLGSALDVGFRDQGLGGFAQLFAGHLDLGAQGFGILGHERLPSSTAALTVCRSALALSTASVGIGGVAWLISFLPTTASTPATARRRTPTTSAASQAGQTRSSARIRVTISTPTPYPANMPAPPNSPAPSPARLPFSTNSIRASANSSRTKVLTSSLSRLTSSAIDGSSALIL